MRLSLAQGFFPQPDNWLDSPGRADAKCDRQKKDLLTSRERMSNFCNQNREEQIIETQDKPQCLVAAKATLTLTIPGCN